jgi:uncharacterized membrane protein YkvA (DUF1232 family)
MRRLAASPTSSPMPLRARAIEPTADTATVALDGPALARFNDVLHSIHPDAPHLDRTRLEALAQWLLELPPAHARRELHQRLARLRELRRMADDVDWDTDVAQRSRLQRLLLYVVDRDDLIPDSTPRIGRLDDALLVELAWPAFADELEDYLDFCRFRHEQHPRGAPPLKRSAWVRMRFQEGALWQQMQRVRQFQFAELGPVRELRVM